MRGNRTVALIEDDPDLHELLRYNLEREGFRLAGSKTGRDALDFLRRTKPDLILLDIMLPDIDGLEICKDVRRDPELCEVPIIFLTARVSESDRILGLDLGANDYIVKPFFVRELIARIKLQFRSKPGARSVLSGGGLELDRDSMEVRRGGRKISLTTTEFRLLEFLMSHPRRVFSREQLLDRVWGREHYPTDRTVDACVHRLRQKLQDDISQPKWIHSVRGIGYTFDPERNEA